VSQYLEKGGGTMIKTQYKVNVIKDGALWFIQVPSHENIFTQAQNIDEIEPMTREVISLMLEIPEDSFDLEFSFASDKSPA
jgi:predicted RNase H-like HicB family nuclease